MPALTRPQLCGRITALRNALDILCSQSAVDGHGSFACRGTMKVELMALEAALRTMATAQEYPVIQYLSAFGLNVPFLARKEG